ncbi:MAG: type II toxin-antitoxin system HipA family toxin [Myxococcales bacterium]|nr:type II toxin-antitoxin system HipA family toxin [Myxococcales bacterium]
MPAGTLWCRTVRGRESFSFEYSAEWLAHPASFSLDPNYLPLVRGPLHAGSAGGIFPGLTDSAPDRWGQALMRRAARRQGRSRPLFSADYLLGVHDDTRLGAVRFREPSGPYLSSHGEPVPPLVRLGELLRAADGVQRDDEDREALQLLLTPGSSLGGARPKASVLDQHDKLSIAKFPALTDDWPVIRWEHVALDLAHRAGLTVPARTMIELAGRHVLLLRRFDRAPDGTRVPFLSALAMLGADDGESHSYLELADALRQHGEDVEHGLRELWDRMAFNVLISNTDDHLRNHGFLRGRRGWYPSPAFDLNPVPTDVRPRVHALALTEDDDRSSLENVLAMAPYFGLSDAEARRRAVRIGEATATWREVAARAGLTPREIDRMETAFEHADARLVASL